MGDPVQDLIDKASRGSDDRRAKLTAIWQQAKGRQDPENSDNLLWDRVQPPMAGPVTGPSVSAYNKPVVVDQDGAVSKINSAFSNNSARQEMQQDLYKAGFIFHPNYFDNYNTFQEANANAIQVYKTDTERDKDESYTEWLHRQAKEGRRDSDGEGGSGGGGGRGGGGGYTGPVTTTSVNLTNEFDAEVLVNDALGRYLGRDATDSELRQFWKKLNKSERANPNISVSQSNGRGSASGLSKGGYNPQLAAEKFAENRDDYAEVTAETTFKGLMEKAIRSRMGGELEGMV